MCVYRTLSVALLLFSLSVIKRQLGISVLCLSTHFFCLFVSIHSAFPYLFIPSFCAYVCSTFLVLVLQPSFFYLFYCFCFKYRSCTTREGSWGWKVRKASSECSASGTGCHPFKPGTKYVWILKLCCVISIHPSTRVTDLAKPYFKDSSFQKGDVLVTF